MSKTAGKAFDLLRCIADSDNELGLMELAGRAELDKSTTLRLLGFLTDRQLLVRAASKAYRVGPALVAMATAALRHSDLRQIAGDHIVKLRDLSEETVSLYLRVEDERICIDGAESNHAVRRALPSFERLPLTEGPSGKAILAFLPSLESDRLVRNAVPNDADRSALLEQLSTVRQLGGFVAVGDRTPNVGAASCPIYAPIGVIGSITVAGPADRWSLERMEEFFPELRTRSQQITRALGGVWVEDRDA